MDKRLLRQFRMAHGHHSNRTAKQEDQQVSRGNGNKENAPPKLEDKANGIDALHPSIKRYQQKILAEHSQDRGSCRDLGPVYGEFVPPAQGVSKVMREQKKHERCRVLTLSSSQRHRDGL